MPEVPNDGAPAGPIDDGDLGAANIALDTKADATNRGLRTALQFLVVSVFVDVVPVLYSALDAADAGDDLDEGRLLRAVLRIVLGGLLAVVMRFLTPPPAPQP